MKRQLFTGAEHYSRAAFTYAGQSREHTFVTMPAATVRGGNLPPWLTSPSDLDFLDAGNPLFVADRALFSCGPYLHGTSPYGMFSRRAGVTILGDSGGYQFIGNPGLWLGNATRAWVLAWQEANTDEAITLDIPTAAIRAGTPWPDFAAALDTTLDSLRFFASKATGGTRHLNALQGRTPHEALAWYEAVKWFPGGGWALGGALRRDFAHVVRLLRRMSADGLLGEDRNRVHVLGRADLKTAVALSAIQRGMRDFLGDPSFLITFDASSPSLLAANRSAYLFPELSPTSFAMRDWTPPTGIRGRNPQERARYSASRWPAESSAVASRVRMSDINVAKPGSLAQTAWDQLSEALIVHHNVQSLLSGIEMANKVLELHPSDAGQLAPDYVVRAYNALIGACTARDPMPYLRPYLGDIARL